MNLPELPEVETVKETLKRKVLNQRINSVDILWPGIIAYPTVEEFKENIKNQKINDITRRGKWLIFELDNYILMSHLRMEGKYFFKTKNDELKKHEHVIFNLDKSKQLRYHDTRKFGKMHLIKKEDFNNYEVIQELGLEPWDEKLNIKYLKDKYKNKRLPIKTVILDQSIITGIGNIYADEILFLSGINPLTKANKLKDKELENIIHNTKITLEKAISEGGTTIRSYTSDEGVSGKFQNNLYVHQREKEKCLNCGSEIIKIKVGGRGTYYCPNCQK